MHSPLDRSTPPPASKIRPFLFPNFAVNRLSNGLKILHVKQDQVPLCTLELFSEAGAREEKIPGLATLHGNLLDEGTQNLSALEIAQRTERLGGYLSSAANWDVGYINSTYLDANLDAGMHLVAELARQPTFPEAEIERARQQRSAEILRRRNQPNALGDQVFSSVIYNNTVYANPLIGTAGSIETLERHHFEDFYQHHFKNDSSTLIAVGKFDTDHLVRLAEDAFGDWEIGPVGEAPKIEPVPLPNRQVHIFDRPGSAQTRLQLGHAGIPRNHPDFEKFLVMNGAFGGKFTSRINLNLREEHAFTYGASSRLVRRRGPGPFTITTSVKSEVTGAAVRELLFELERIREDTITEDELRETCDYLIGVFPYTLQSISDVAQRLEDLLVFDLPLDLYQSYPASLNQITREDVLEAARQHLDPERLAIVAVGSAETLEPQLAPFGDLRIWNADDLT